MTIKSIETDLVALPRKLPAGPIWVFPVKVKIADTVDDIMGDGCIDQLAWSILIDVILRQQREAQEKAVTKKRASRLILKRKRELRDLRR